MATAPMLGTGATITFSGWSGEVMSIKWSGAFKRESIQTSHLGTTNAHTFMPGTLYDLGEVTIEFQGDTGTDYKAMATSAAATLTVAWSSGVSLAGSAFCTGIDMSMELETLQVWTATFKMTGEGTQDITP